MADAYLTHTVRDLPAHFVFQPDGKLRDVFNAVPKGVVRVIAGATECHVVIDIKRPYFRPIAKGVHLPHGTPPTGRMEG